jgi:hypothetical protein
LSGFQAFILRLREFRSLLMKFYVSLRERHFMGAVAFGEGRLPRWYRGWSLLRRSSCRLRHRSPGCDGCAGWIGWIGYEGREPLPQGQHFITDIKGWRSAP